MVLVDTSIWSTVLRTRQRREQRLSNVAFQLRDLIADGEVAIIGAVRQEILTGFRSHSQFVEFRDYLRYFVDGPTTTEDFENAAEYANTCKADGLQGSSVDFLICAVAIRRGWEVFTTDRDFDRYAELLPLRLYVSS